LVDKKVWVEHGRILGRMGESFVPVNDIINEAIRRGPNRGRFDFFSDEYASRYLSGDPTSYLLSRQDMLNEMFEEYATLVPQLVDILDRAQERDELDKKFSSALGAAVRYQSFVAQ
jgi:predicted PolB exonuclease-like 3'-5' exonuclease